jgi:hypothetical protein
MSSASRPFSQGLPFAGMAFPIAAVLGLLLVAERSGLPTAWAEPAAFAVLVAALGVGTWMSRTAMESRFFGRERFGGSLFGGVILGFLLTGATMSFHGGGHSVLWFPALAGALGGLVIAHLFSRLRVVIMQERAQRRGGSRAAHAVLGVALILMGGTIAAFAVQSGLGEMDAIFGTKGGLSVFLALILPFFAVVLGGCYGGLSLCGMLALLSLSGLAVMAAVGFAAFGTPPLPGFSDSQTLAVIADLRARWGLTGIAFLEQWPPLAALFDVSTLPTTAFSAVAAAAIALSLSPAVPVRRRSVTLVAMATVCLVPLLMIVVGGYAIEAAAKQFVGAPINRPPPGLLEALRLGLVSVCGGIPETADALGRQCGVSPRDTAVLTVEQIRFSAAFLQSGLTVAIGSASVINAVARMVSLAMVGAGLVAGLWMMALGLGSHILGWKHQAAGLASQRLAVTRMAAVIAVAVAATASIYGLVPALDQARMLAGGAALTVLLMQALLAWNERTGLSASAPEKPSAPAKGRRRKAAASAPGELA